MMSHKHYLISLLCAFMLMDGFSQGFMESKAFILYENSQINHDSAHYKTYKIDAGDFLVFEFRTDNGGDPGNHSVADSRVAFYIDSDVSSFNYSNEEMLITGLLYIQRCHCQDKGIHIINEGTLKGEKQANGSWSVEFDVSFLGRNTGKVYRIHEKGIYSTEE